MLSILIPSLLAGIGLTGLSLLWSTRMVYRGAGRDVGGSYMLLSMLGWLLFLGSLACGFGAIFVFRHVISLVIILVLVAVTAVVLVMAFGRYLGGERTSLIWALKVAAEKGIPLGQAAHAFADERYDMTGQRARRMAMLLDNGVPLPNAMVMSGHYLNVDAKLAIDMGSSLDVLGPALHYAVEGAEESQEALRSILEKIFYLTLVLLVLSMIFLFLVVKIVPVFQRMFQEFALELPLLSQAVMASAKELGLIAAIGGPLLALVSFVAFLGFLQYLGLLPRDLPGAAMFTRKIDGARVLKALSIAVGQGRSLSETLRFLSVHYPKQAVCRLIVEAGRMVNDGAHWCDALHKVTLLSRADTAVLKAAERVGNLGWAMDQMGDRAVRRASLRLRFWTNLVFPVLMATVGFLILVVVVAMFLPLVSLIQGLS